MLIKFKLNKAEHSFVIHFRVFCQWYAQGAVAVWICLGFYKAWDIECLIGAKFFSLRSIVNFNFIHLDPNQADSVYSI